MTRFLFGAAALALVAATPRIGPAARRQRQPGRFARRRSGWAWRHGFGRRHVGRHARPRSRHHRYGHQRPCPCRQAGRSPQRTGQRVRFDLGRLFARRCDRRRRPPDRRQRLWLGLGRCRRGMRSSSAPIWCAARRARQSVAAGALPARRVPPRARRRPVLRGAVPTAAPTAGNVAGSGTASGMGSVSGALGHLAVAGSAALQRGGGVRCRAGHGRHRCEGPCDRHRARSPLDCRRHRPRGGRRGRRPDGHPPRWQFLGLGRRARLGDGQG